MSTLTHLLLIRHGEVEDRYHHVFGGRTDMDLSPRGHQQAAHLADYLRGKPLDAIYVSPMKRARQTVKPIAEATGLAATAMDDLREVDFGEWTGLHWNEVQQRYGVTAFDWLDMLASGKINGAETADQLRARLEPCLNTILQSHGGHSVAVVCHGGVIRMLLSILLEVPITKMAGVQVEYASLTRVARIAGRTEAQLVNFTPWRELA